MPNLLGADPQQQSSQTTDFLGQSVPVAFQNQPALPQAGAGGPGGGASTAPATIGGTGVGAPPAAPEGGGFSDLSGAALGGMELGGGGDSGQGDVGGAEGGLGDPQSGGLLGSLTPANSPIGVSPTGSISINTGNPKFDAAVNTLGKTVLGMFGVPTGVPGLISLLSNSSIVGLVSAALGAVGAPLTFINAVHLLSTLSPTSTTSLQTTIQGLGGRANSPDPFGEIAPEDIEATLSQLSPAELSAIAQGKNIGPAVGTAMTQGTFGFSPANTATARSDNPNNSSAIGAVPGAPGQPGTSASESAGVAGPAAAGGQSGQSEGAAAASAAAAAAAAASGGTAGAPGAPGSPGGPSGDASDAE